MIFPILRNVTMQNCLPPGLLVDMDWSIDSILHSPYTRISLINGDRRLARELGSLQHAANYYYGALPGSAYSQFLKECIRVVLTALDGLKKE
jgi:hypothetical protein